MDEATAETAALFNAFDKAMTERVERPKTGHLVARFARVFRFIANGNAASD
jgi:hypothetical protein